MQHGYRCYFAAIQLFPDSNFHRQIDTSVCLGKTLFYPVEPTRDAVDTFGQPLKITLEPNSFGA
jgi:hypothetical protein